MTIALCEYFKNKSNASKVFTVDGTSLEIKGIGNFKRVHKTKKIFIPEVRFIPKLNLNLLSIS